MSDEIFLDFSNFFITNDLFTQERKTDILPGQSVEVYIGYSKNGTGDVWGLIFSSKHSKYLKHRLHWDVASTDTIHDGSDPLFFKDENGKNIDGSVRWATGGVQCCCRLEESFDIN